MSGVQQMESLGARRSNRHRRVEMHFVRSSSSCPVSSHQRAERHTSIIVFASSASHVRMGQATVADI
eukprot:5756950-Karenia_brevis.AAC.1